MGELSVCFKADVYNRAVELMVEDGYSGQEVALEGKYLCAEGRTDIIISEDVYLEVPTDAKNLWMDDNGRYHKIVQVSDLPAGVEAVAFGIIGEGEDSNFLLSVYKYYKCVDESFFTSNCDCRPSVAEKILKKKEAEGCVFVEGVEKKCDDGKAGSRNYLRLNCHGQIEEVYTGNNCHAGLHDRH